jgi:ESS family glutamate:Na+ symporter
MSIKMDMYQTLALAVVALMIGNWLRRKVDFLVKFSIPAPVVGGLVFAIATCVLHVTGILDVSFDDTLREVCMVFFFTSVGFQANMKVLKSGGKDLIIFLVLVIVMIVLQNMTAIGLSWQLKISPLVGMCTGSIPMVGGHGTAGAFGPVLEDFGVKGATTIATAAATYGLIAGSLMGGPLGDHLIKKYSLLDTYEGQQDASVLVEDEKEHKREVSMYPKAVFQVVIAIGIGTVISALLSKTGLTFPIYIGAMIAAAVMRNYGEMTGRFEVCMGEINDLGGIALSLFLGIAMITLQIWQLADLALPLIVLLVAQTVFMFIYASLIVFRAMGKDYDAAILVSGICGFGMGATPNAMANMQVLCEKYEYSVKAFIIVPVVGSLFADFLNSLIITFFINIL